jgi:hypothetical protein
MSLFLLLNLMFITKIYPQMNKNTSRLFLLSQIMQENITQSSNSKRSDLRFEGLKPVFVKRDMRVYMIDL